MAQKRSLEPNHDAAIDAEQRKVEPPSKKAKTTESYYVLVGIDNVDDYKCRHGQEWSTVGKVSLHRTRADAMAKKIEAVTARICECIKCDYDRDDRDFGKYFLDDDTLDLARIKADFADLEAHIQRGEYGSETFSYKIYPVTLPQM